MKPLHSTPSQYLLTLLLALPLSSMAALAHAETENRAVVTPNQQISAAYAETDNIKGFTLDARLALPLTRYTGAVFTAAAYDIDGKRVGVNGSNGLSLGGELFLRDNQRGLLGFSYTQTRVDYDSPSSLPTKNNQTYGLSAQYYRENLTLSADRGITRGDSEGNNLIYGGAWYPTDNMRITAKKFGMDNAGLYLFALTAQPAFLGGDITPYLSYQTRFDGDPFTSLGITYFFQKNISLKDRDRRY